MSQIALRSDSDSAEIYYLRSVVLTSAEKLLAEVKRRNWKEIDLDELSILRSELHFIINKHSHLIKDTFIQAELKSYRLALTIQIELRQHFV